MGLHTRWIQVRQFFQTSRTKGRRLLEEEEARPGPSRAEQASQREERRLGGLSAEDQAWEQASLQRDRDRHAQPRQAPKEEAP